MKRLVAIALMMMLLAACSRSAPPVPEPPTVDWPHSPGQVIFQIYAAGGLVGALDAEANVPELTIFGDGRAVFERADRDGTRRLLEGRVPDGKLKALVAQADQSLIGQEEQYMGAYATDMAVTRFTVVTAERTRSLSIYGFSPEPWDGDNEAVRPVLERLRSLRRGFLDALAKDVAPYTPDSVTLLTERLDSEPGRMVREWPEELPPLPAPPDELRATGKLAVTGDAARELARQIPYRSFTWYRAGGAYYWAAVKPHLPVLRQP